LPQKEKEATLARCSFEIIVEVAFVAEVAQLVEHDLATKGKGSDLGKV